MDFTRRIKKDIFSRIIGKNVFRSHTNFANIKILKAGYKTHFQHIECNLIRTENQSIVLWF
jgi:hypothetical protein